MGPVWLEWRVLRWANGPWHFDAQQDRLDRTGFEREQGPGSGRATTGCGPQTLAAIATKPR